MEEANHRNSMNVINLMPANGHLNFLLAERKHGKAGKANEILQYASSYQGCLVAPRRGTSAPSDSVSSAYSARIGLLFHPSAVYLSFLSAEWSHFDLRSLCLSSLSRTEVRHLDISCLLSLCRDRIFTSLVLRLVSVVFLLFADIAL